MSTETDLSRRVKKAQKKSTVFPGIFLGRPCSFLLYTMRSRALQEAAPDSSSDQLAKRLSSRCQVM